MEKLSALLGNFLTTYGLLAILVVMLLKEAGVPVPSDLIMITAGVQAATGSYSLIELLLAIEFAMLVGGSAQFLIARGAGRQFIYLSRADTRRLPDAGCLFICGREYNHPL